MRTNIDDRIRFEAIPADVLEQAAHRWDTVTELGIVRSLDDQVRQQAIPQAGWHRM
jgi:hypothetical protein